MPAIMQGTLRIGHATLARAQFNPASAETGFLVLI